MTPKYTITAARPQDLTRLAAIELAAAQLLVGHAPESVLNETTSLDLLEKAQREGHLWVALADDGPVGFAHVELIERDAVHLEEIDVHPDHSRRGLGRKRSCKSASGRLARGTSQSRSRPSVTCRGICRSTRDSGSQSFLPSSCQPVSML